MSWEPGISDLKWEVVRLRKHQMKVDTAMLMIGVTQEGIREALAAIIEILSVEKAGDEAKVEALKSLATLCKVGDPSVTNCSFVSGETPREKTNGGLKSSPSNPAQDDMRDKIGGKTP